MDDALIEIEYRPRPTADRPFLGLTVLVVEDSRYASEAVRLMCLRSGARIRRADCIGSAERHLHVYRPTIAIVDLGLPDGSGLDLITRMDAMRPRVPVLLGTSGADRAMAQAAVMKAGGDGFLAKPIESLAQFQNAIMSHLPAEICARMPRPVDDGAIEPDLIAFREDHPCHRPFSAGGAAAGLSQAVLAGCRPQCARHGAGGASHPYRRTSGHG